MRFRLIPVLLIALIGSVKLEAQKRTVGAIGFYNVENLFDIEDHPEKNDDEYTPDGERKWDQEKYNNKLKNISEVLSKMANGPDVVGLSEVENLFVLQELVAQPALKKHNYQVVHIESPDWRGIDCALIYKPDRFKLLNYEAVPFPDSTYNTRDILHVTGLYFGDTLHVYVNHWPSRLGGKADRRMESADQLRKEIDKLLAKNADTKIIVMGDLNDDPINKSVKKVLRSVDKDFGDGDLYNVSAETFRNGVGTLYYRGAWNLFDQIMVSQGLLPEKSGVTYQGNTFSIFGPDWMRQTTGQYAGAPLRTFAGGAYLNGFSDHFPTYILLEK